jgi:hypothetical protein
MDDMIAKVEEGDCSCSAWMQDGNRIASWMVQCDATYTSSFILGSYGWRTCVVQVDVWSRKRVKKIKI